MAEHSLVWSATALANLQEISDYIAQDKPDAARRWAKTLAAMGDDAAELPLAGRRVPEFGRDDVRERINRGYRVIYLVSDEQVEILAVTEGHRQLSSDILGS